MANSQRAQSSLTINNPICAWPVQVRARARVIVIVMCKERVEAVGRLAGSSCSAICRKTVSLLNNFQIFGAHTHTKSFVYTQAVVYSRSFLQLFGFFLLSYFFFFFLLIFILVLAHKHNFTVCAREFPATQNTRMLHVHASMW